MDTKTIVIKVSKLVQPTIEQFGYELIETEYLNEHGKWILRLYIDSESGITLSDCEKVSRAVSAILDVDDVVPARYNLEVSSPGIPRPVRREEDFIKYKGAVVKIRMSKEFAGRRNFTGVITGVEDGSVCINEGGKAIRIPIENIHKARLQETGAHRGEKNG